MTVTDAHLVLGRLPNALLGGTLALNRAAAEEALAEFGKRKRLGPGEMASGIVQIANHQMCGAVRHISVRRGHDLRDYVLLAMGGAGPLHATELAELLGMSTVLIPPAPGLAAAFGLLVADFRADFVHAFRRRESEIDAARVRQVINALEAQAWTGLAREEIPIAQRQLVRAADFHYVGMSAEWTVPLGGGLVTADAIHQAIEGFHSLFERRCGYSYRGKEEVELINLRVTGIGLLPKPSLPTIATATSDPVPVGRRSVFFLERQGFVDCPIYTRVGLGAGATFTGPAIVEQYDSTTVVSPGWQARVDAFGNLILQR